MSESTGERAAEALTRLVHRNLTAESMADGRLVEAALVASPNEQAAEEAVVLAAYHEVVLHESQVGPLSLESLTRIAIETATPLIAADLRAALVVAREQLAAAREENDRLRVMWDRSGKNDLLAQVARVRARCEELAALCPEDDWPESGDMSNAAVADAARYILRALVASETGEPK